MNSLVGDTGFVGSNILAQAGDFFSGRYNSRNISLAFGTRPELLVYAGVRAEKYLADRFPERDLAGICEAFSNIEAIDPKRVVLISTIDVFPEPVGVDETSAVDPEGLSPYGADRFRLEELVRRSGRESLIVRLPALYGRNLKKNFIFDMIRVVPALLTKRRLAELSERDPGVREHYRDRGDGFFECTAKSREELDALRRAFERIGFSAAEFTDSRAAFQFYNLAFLWGHIRRALGEGIGLLHLAAEPVGTAELFRFVEGKEFRNELSGKIPHYDFRTVHADRWGGRNGYLFGREFVLEDVKRFVEGCRE